MKLIYFDIGIKNMAYCLANCDENLNLISLNKIDLKIGNKDNIQKLIDNTIDFLDEIKIELGEFDKLIVLIECQMTSKMKCIQTTINTYFKMLSKFEGLDIETIYLSPKHKLELTKKYPEYSYIDKNDAYKSNKINAISFASYLLINKYSNDEFLRILNGFKKKDDVADALLMVIYYYEKIKFL